MVLCRACVRANSLRGIDTTARAMMCMLVVCANCVNTTALQCMLKYMYAIFGVNFAVTRSNRSKPLALDLPRDYVQTVWHSRMLPHSRSTKVYANVC